MNRCEIYTDLLIKILANTIYGDPHATGQDRILIHQYGTTEETGPPLLTSWSVFEKLCDLTQRTLDENILGDFIETGVWRGGCCILMRGVLLANSIRDRKVYVADSFQGLPPLRPHLFPKDTGDIHHTIPELAVSIDEVKANFRRYDLLDDQVIFVKVSFATHCLRLMQKRFHSSGWMATLRCAGKPLP
jgi:hypothetical protein